MCDSKCNNNKKPEIELVPMFPDLVLPTYATDGSAAIDLEAHPEDFWPTEGYWLQPGEVLKVSTGIRIWINNPSIAAFLMPRSGLGTRGLVLANTIGLIDSDYQGPVIAALYNRSDEPIRLQIGQKICQLVFQPVIQVQFKEMLHFSNETARGTGGFGSTDKLEGAA